MKITAKQNNVKLVVNVGTHPTITDTKNGQRMAAFSACSIEPDPETGLTRRKWYTTICWGNLAEVAKNHLTKGKRVVIFGNIVVRKWHDKKGNIREREQLIATNIVLLNTGRTPVNTIAA
ncbi:MAG TPA: single-stranded DNA-binding protein [Bacteroidia bacterium]|jgi:single stranded DNA-binding protein|nr:single-stranded DNA-binding protein [Bacteroidia bacterium]